jgi:hypothetical protein
VDQERIRVRCFVSLLITDLGRPQTNDLRIQQLRKQLTERWNITKYQKSNARLDPGADSEARETVSDFNETPIEAMNGCARQNMAPKRKAQQTTLDTLASKRLKNSQMEGGSLDHNTDRQISELVVPMSGSTNCAPPNITNSTDDTVGNQEDSQYQSSMGSKTLLNSTLSGEGSFSRSGESGVLSPQSSDCATLWSGSRSRNLSDGSSFTAPKVRLDFFQQFKLPQRSQSRSNEAEVRVDDFNIIKFDAIAALQIDVADSTKVYSDKESETIQEAADLLFACGLRVDAFPLYLLLWKHLIQQKKADLGADIFIQCLRCICTEEHCFIMKNLLNDQLNSMEDTVSQDIRAKACLFRLAMARICSVEGEKELIRSHLQNASHHLKELDEMFYQFATATVLTTPDFIKARQVLPAILEEVLLVTESHSLRMRSVMAQVKSILNQKATSGLALALNLRKHTRLRTHEIEQSVRDDISHLFNWLSIVLDTETRIKKLLLAHGSIDADLALFSHIWLEWKVPFWMDERTIQLRKKLEGTVTIELLAVLASLLADHEKDANSFGTEYGFDILLSAANFQLSKLKTMNEEVTSNGQLLELIQERYIWMLRRHALHHFDLSPQLRKSLRTFVERTLNITLPDIPTHLSKQEDNRPLVKSMFYGNTTLSRSLHPSESSSYRVFAESGKKSLRSVCTPCSYSSYSSPMRPEFNGKLFSVFDDTLSVSLQSMSIAGEDGSAEILDGSEHGRGGTRRHNPQKISSIMPLSTPLNAGNQSVNS